MTLSWMLPRFCILSFSYPKLSILSRLSSERLEIVSVISHYAVLQREVLAIQGYRNRSDSSRTCLLKFICTKDTIFTFPSLPSFSHNGSSITCGDGEAAQDNILKDDPKGDLSRGDHKQANGDENSGDQFVCITHTISFRDQIS